MAYTIDMRYIPHSLPSSISFKVLALFVAVATAATLVISALAPQKVSAEDCVRAPHTFTFSNPTEFPAQQTAQAGTTVYYHVEIYNHDSVGCGKSLFSITNENLPAGWNFAPANGTELIDSPEATGYTMWYTSPANAYNGDYDFTVNISRSEEPTVVPVHLRYTVTGGQTAPDTSAPQVSILSPTAGAIVKKGSTVNISAAVSDNVGVTRLDYYVDGFVVCINYGTTCPWKTPNRKGTYLIEVRAQDAAGNIGTASRSVTAN